MYPNNFFIPAGNMGFAPSGLGLGGINAARTSGIFSSLKKFNWSSLLSGANKTLNVVNQTIPLIKQAGPMIDNMKSMVKLASVFKDETDTRKSKKNSVINNTQNNYNNKNNINNNDNENSLSINYSNTPNFFI